jgi:hypothetical protein
VGRFPWEEVARASINMKSARIGLVRSVNWDHGTRMDHIVPAPTTYSVTQVGYNIMLLCILELCQTLYSRYRNVVLGGHADE